MTVARQTDGVLVLSVFDKESKGALWHGVASKRLSQSFMVPELIDEAVDTLFEDFPAQFEAMEASAMAAEDQMS